MLVEFDVLYALQDRTGRRHGRANDLSAGGLRLSTDEDLLKGSILDLDFRLPDDFLAELTIEKEVFEQTPFGLRPETLKAQPPPFEPMRVRGGPFDVLHSEPHQLAHGMKFVDIEEDAGRADALRPSVAAAQIRLRQKSNR